MSLTCVLCKIEEGEIPDRSFHLLPKEETIREKWISIIRQCVGENWEPTEGTYLCSHHFADSNFIQPQDELVKVDTKPTILNENAQGGPAEEVEPGPSQADNKIKPQKRSLEYDSDEDDESEDDDSQNPFAPKDVMMIRSFETQLTHLEEYEKKLKNKVPLNEKDLHHYNELKTSRKEMERKLAIWAYTKFDLARIKKRAAAKEKDSDKLFSDSDDEGSDFENSDDDSDIPECSYSEILSALKNRVDLLKSLGKHVDQAEEKSMLKLFTEQKQQIKEYKLKKDLLSEKDIAHVKQLKSSSNELQGKLLKWTFSKVKGGNVAEVVQCLEANPFVQSAYFPTKANDFTFEDLLLSGKKKSINTLKGKIEHLLDILEPTEDGVKRVSGKKRKMIEEELKRTVASRNKKIDKLNEEEEKIVMGRLDLMKKDKKRREEEKCAIA